MTTTLEAPQQTSVSYGTEAERRIEEMAKELRKAGWDVEVTVVFHGGMVGSYTGDRILSDTVSARLMARGQDFESLFVSFVSILNPAKGRRRSTRLSFANRYRPNMPRRSQDKRLRTVKDVNWEVYAISQWHTV